jgi:uncharacterized protein
LILFFPKAHYTGFKANIKTGENMLVVVSPAKKLDFENPAKAKNFTKPKFIKESKALIKHLKNLTTNDIAKLMKLSDKLAKLNYDRFQSFSTPFSPKNAKQAMYAFRGDTYVGLEAETLSENDLDYAQDHLRILSGLYGALSPLDLIQPYRLEMGTKFAQDNNKNLYEFWGSKITHHINEAANGSKYLINCASTEYFSAVKKDELEPTLIEVHFKVQGPNGYRVVGIHAKKARGAMAKFIIINKVKTLEKLKKFDELGFVFNSDLSSKTELTFTRDD